MLAQFAKVMGSQAGLAVVGLVTLPIIARNFQAELFGRFSLFLVLLGSISLIDFCRPLLVRKFADLEESFNQDDITAVSLLNLFVVSSTAGSVGAVFLSTPEALFLTLACFLHAAASPAYAENAVRFGAGNVQLFRNMLWSFAYLVVATTGFFVQSIWSYLLPFSIANLALVFIYGKTASGTAFRPDWRNIYPSDRRIIRDSWHILSFNLITAFVSSVDKVGVEKFVGGDVYGRYMAQSTLALKGNLAGTALGQTLYPELSVRMGRDGLNKAADYFARIFCWAMLAFGAAILIPILASDKIIDILFGTSYQTDIDIFAIVLVGVYLQMMGMMLTPWQRARGDFEAARNAYFVAAIFMLAGAFILIPAYGIIGAVGVYLLGRIGELILLIREWRILFTTRHFRRYWWVIATNFAIILAVVTVRSF